MEPELLAKYICSECKAVNCKLYREYQTFRVNLLCAGCAAKNQKKDITDIDSDGMYTRAPYDAWDTMPAEHRKTDQIGYYVPAIPCDIDGDLGYWGYTSVPEEDVRWWRELPTLPSITQQI